MKAGSGYARPIADGQLQHLAPVPNPAGAVDGTAVYEVKLVGVWVTSLASRD